MDSYPSQVNLPATLEASRINALPPVAYYIADFISEDEEQAILHKVARRASLGLAAASDPVSQR
jgi:alkylated DNA repair protein alkB family protein 6